MRQRPADVGIWAVSKVARWIEKETQRQKVSNQRGWDYLKKWASSWQKPRYRHKKGEAQGQRQFKKKLPLKVKQLKEKYLQAQIEVWFFDEPRIGSKPILKKLRSPVGERPRAVVEPRYQWLYVYGFVEPKTGKNHWYLIPRVNTQSLNVVLKTLATFEEATAEKIILLV